MFEDPSFAVRCVHCFSVSFANAMMQWSNFSCKYLNLEDLSFSTLPHVQITEQKQKQIKKSAENCRIVLKTIQPCHSYHSCLLSDFLSIWMLIKGNHAKICLFSLHNGCQTPSPSLPRSVGALKAKFNTGKALI